MLLKTIEMKPEKEGITLLLTYATRDKAMGSQLLFWKWTEGSNMMMPQFQVKASTALSLSLGSGDSDCQNWQQAALIDLNSTPVCLELMSLFISREEHRTNSQRKEREGLRVSVKFWFVTYFNSEALLDFGKLNTYKENLNLFKTLLSSSVKKHCWLSW